MDQCETNENTQLAITTKGFSAVRSVRLILAIYHIYDNGIEIKSNSESHNMPNHVLWNFGNSNSTISINSGRILGSILAPHATVNANVNVDGNIVGSTVNINGENHRWDLQTPSSEIPSSETPSSETPSSETPKTPKNKHDQQFDHQLPKTDANKSNASDSIALTALATLGISGIVVSRRKK